MKQGSRGRPARQSNLSEVSTPSAATLVMPGWFARRGRAPRSRRSRGAVAAWDRSPARSARRPVPGTGSQASCRRSGRSAGQTGARSRRRQALVGEPTQAGPRPRRQAGGAGTQVDRRTHMCSVNSRIAAAGAVYRGGRRGDDPRHRGDRSRCQQRDVPATSPFGMACTTVSTWA